MFTPKNIQVALEELYDLCDPDYMMDMLENYGEEFDDISPTLLAQAFQKRAEMVSEYRMLSTMDEEAKLTGKDLNRALRDQDGDIYDIIAGDFLVVGLGEEDFSSLSPELMEKFEKKFHQPEMFVRMGRSIMALPLPDDKVKKAGAPVMDAPITHKSCHDRDSL